MAGRRGSNGGLGAEGPERLGDRLRRMFLKPVAEPEPGATSAPIRPPTEDELEARVRSMDDQERLLGVVAAPLAALIGILIGGDEISRATHSQVGTYYSLLGVLVALSVVMLITAVMRKRMYLGISLALYGLAVFNLHYWGFGIPFILGGAWLLVRAYRVQREHRDATEGPGGSGRGGGGAGPRPSKRYTPPTNRPRQPPGPQE
ncbi:MAG TPA: hypothetical protein VMU63_06560 [Acidimicrobiales bacterium]|nr:hypothetical protein [Acidimicrobiales bacterium]